MGKYRKSDHLVKKILTMKMIALEIQILCIFAGIFLRSEFIPEKNVNNRLF